MSVKDLVTEKDGVSWCPLRIGFAIALAIYTGGIIEDWLHVAHYMFSSHAKDIASGYGDIIGYGGGAVAAKNYTESE